MHSALLVPIMLASLMLAIRSPGAAAADDIACRPSGRPPSSLGVVLLHGRQGGEGHDVPPGTGDYWMQPEKRKILAAGFRVVEPEMPWSMYRAYDRSYQESMGEIGAAIDAVKKMGAKRVVLDGFSLGGNAALAYAAARDGVAAVMVVSPGLFPENPRYQVEVAKSVNRARDLIALGLGDQMEMFDDVAVWNGAFVTTPTRLFSYYDPDGDAIMSKNAEKIKPGIPFFWMVGKQDVAASVGKAYAFDRVPPNRLNRYFEVEGGHLDAPKSGADLIVAWLKCL
jgi:pimeloyl-ACP methyl ester carboxylesterase